ncbi:hypothetical protein [Chryseobacterium sp. RLHN22]|uniref:hypothetical protein n=1 Tax=Chryseobacterium sp. RLHN22 TaxID=3437885 RepID=UPI003D9B62FF
MKKIYLLCTVSFCLTIIGCTQCSKKGKSNNLIEESCTEFTRFLHIVKESCGTESVATNLENLNIDVDIRSNFKKTINYPICTAQFNNDSKIYSDISPNTTFKLSYPIFKKLVKQKVNENFTKVTFSYVVVSEEFLDDCKKHLSTINDAADIKRLEGLKGKLYSIITFRHSDSTKNESYLIFDLMKEHKINITKTNLDQYYNNFRSSSIANDIRKIDTANTEVTSGVVYDLKTTQDYLQLIDYYFVNCENKNVDILRFEICYGTKNYNNTKNAIYFATIPEEKGVILNSHFPYFDQGSLEP